MCSVVAAVVVGVVAAALRDVEQALLLKSPLFSCVTLSM